MKVIKSSVKSQLAPGEKRNKAPEDSLKLKFVHGEVSMFYTYTLYIYPAMTSMLRYAIWYKIFGQYHIFTLPIPMGIA